MKFSLHDIHQFRNKLLIVLSMLFFLLLFSSCKNNIENSKITSTPTATSLKNSESSTTSRRINVVLATIDLAIGRNRLTFGLVDSDQSPLRVDSVKTDYLFMDASKIEVLVEGEAKYVQWPVSKSGVYVSRVNFDTPGTWMIRVKGIDNDGNNFFAETRFAVKSKSFTPAIDSKVPQSQNKKLSDVEDISEISSSTDPDLKLYELSILDAINNDLPTVVVFATPKFCMTQTCGPQVAIVSKLREKFEGQVNFIHIEIYENINDIDGDIEKAKISPIVMEWGIVSEPFTFIIKRNGLLHSKFEGYTSENELFDAIDRVINFKK
ncbi:MAG: thioredoxin family protein [SAR202 cluster bacterium]|nr:thioredoxin family protein [SAR202 cluster bacterium]